jgi:uncharacterized protein with PIN domain
MPDGLTQFVAYEGDTCPRCGYHLAAPDDNLDRRCLLCAVTVKAATVTFTFGHDVEVVSDGPDGHVWRCHTCGGVGWYDAGEDSGGHA